MLVGHDRHGVSPGLRNILVFADSDGRGTLSERNEYSYLLCFLSVALITGCTNLPRTATVAAVPVPTPTPENYGLYTDQDLQIYAETIDLKIQQALKNNDANQAQELGRKRQELIAEFNRRHLKRITVVPSLHHHRPRPASPQHPPAQHRLFGSNLGTGYRAKTKLLKRTLFEVKYMKCTVLSLANSEVKDGASLFLL